MIQGLKQKFTKSFLQVISEEGIGFGKWNKDKTIFKFTLDEELLFDEYIEFDDYPNPHYIEHFIESLELFEGIGILKSYKSISSPWDIKFDEEKFIENTKNRILNFKDIFLQIGGDYLLEYDINKLKFLNEILHNTRKVKYNFSLGLLKAILKVISNQNRIKSDSIGNFLKEQNHIDIEVLIDYLQIDNEKYIFYDFEVLIYALSIYKMVYIAKLLNFLLEVLDKDNKKILLSAIKLDNVFNYYSDKQIQESNESERSILLNPAYDISQSTYEKIINYNISGNIGYIESNINDLKLIKKENSKIIYNKSNNILEYNGKKVNFSQARLQKAFVEKLYNNINNWVSEDDIKGNGQQILKDMFNKKMKLKTGGGFNSLEFKQLFQTFEDNKKRYFIMIG